ncbi:hypothetical protein LTR66_012193 [Elasticomyces elasticus]|nr:hypothetical protein LTR66_012193 [Elasticomyces elasticus]
MCKYTCTTHACGCKTTIIHQCDPYALAWSWYLCERLQSESIRHDAQCAGAYCKEWPQYERLQANERALQLHGARAERMRDELRKYQSQARDIVDAAASTGVDGTKTGQYKLALARAKLAWEHMGYAMGAWQASAAQRRQLLAGVEAAASRTLGIPARYESAVASRCVPPPHHTDQASGFVTVPNPADSLLTCGSGLVQNPPCAPVPLLTFQQTTTTPENSSPGKRSRQETEQQIDPVAVPLNLADASETGKKRKRGRPFGWRKNKTRHDGGKSHGKIPDHQSRSGRSDGHGSPINSSQPEVPSSVRRSRRLVGQTVKYNVDDSSSLSSGQSSPTRPTQHEAGKTRSLDSGVHRGSMAGDVVGTTAQTNPTRSGYLDLQAGYRFVPSTLQLSETASMTGLPYGSRNTAAPKTSQRVGILGTPISMSPGTEQSNTSRRPSAQNSDHSSLQNLAEHESHGQSATGFDLATAAGCGVEQSNMLRRGLNDSPVPDHRELSDPLRSGIDARLPTPFSQLADSPAMSESHTSQAALQSHGSLGRSPDGCGRIVQSEVLRGPASGNEDGRAEPTLLENTPAEDCGTFPLRTERPVPLPRSIPESTDSSLTQTPTLTRAEPADVGFENTMQHQRTAPEHASDPTPAPPQVGHEQAPPAPTSPTTAGSAPTPTPPPPAAPRSAPILQTGTPASTLGPSSGPGDHAADAFTKPNLIPQAAGSSTTTTTTDANTSHATIQGNSIPDPAFLVQDASRFTRRSGRSTDET